MDYKSLPIEQRGAVLVVSLLMLLVMTLIGVTAMQSNIMEEKMAGNFRDVNLAFQSAETALRDAESDLTSRVTGLTNFSADCINGLCDATGGLLEVWKDDPNDDSDDTRAANGVDLSTYTDTPLLPLVAQQPQYWIEGYKVRPPGSASWKYQYRITAIGYGGNTNTQVILQTVYAP